jgi:putative phosphoserine phosphatase / 1-acylglycerol-3-phosphate O-acyltransferase
VLNVVHPPVVRVRVGEAVELKGRSVDADTRRIMKAITALLPPEAHIRRKPTEEELARTYPSGRPEGDADGEDGDDAG